MMLALPMQGFASASMQYCGKSVDHMALQTPANPESQHHHADSGNGAHAHALQAKLAHAASSESAPDVKSQLPDAGHKCGVCASCCNLVGMPAATGTLAIHSAANAVYTEPSVLIYSLSLDLPEKPPRA